MEENTVTEQEVMENSDVEVVENEVAEDEIVEDASIAEESEEDEQSKYEKKPWFRRRFDELSREREEAYKLAERERAAREEVERKLKEARLSVPAGDKPKIEDFETDAEFFEALTDWKYEQREKTREAERRAKETETKQRTQKEEFGTRVRELNAKGISKYKDYEEVVFSAPADVFNEDMVRAVLETDNPEDISYHLAKHPDQARRLAGMTPYRKAIELGKIEARLANKKETSAPPPIKPVKGRESGTVDYDKLLETNPGEWMRLRNEGVIK